MRTGAEDGRSARDEDRGRRSQSSRSRHRGPGREDRGGRPILHILNQALSHLLLLLYSIVVGYSCVVVSCVFGIVHVPARVSFLVAGRSFLMVQFSSSSSSSVFYRLTWRSLDVSPDRFPRMGMRLPWEAGDGADAADTGVVVT